MIERPERQLLDHKGRPVTWRSWFPPDLDPEHPPFFEYVDDDKGREWCFWYDPMEAYRWATFSPEYCVFIEGDDSIVGKPMHLLDWQLGPTREMFGWKLVRNDQPQNVRRYRSGDIWVPKKNSKTTWGVSLALAGIKLDNHRQAQGYYGCATADQGDDAGWRIVTAMVRSEQGRLKDEYIAWEQHIEHEPTDSALHLITSSGEGRAGKNPHFAVWDEVWEFRSKAAVRQILTGMVAQKNPFTLSISTVGNDTTVWAYQDYLRDKKILKGEIKDPRHLPVIFEAPEGADPHDRRIWALANPGWGVTVNEDSLETIYEKSLSNPQDFADFCQMHLGMWVSGSQEYITDKQWAFCQKQFTEAELLGRFAYGAIDLAATVDMCSFALAFPFIVPAEANKEPTVIFKLLVWYWVPDITAKEKARNDRRYEQWIDEGWLFRTPGETVDYKEIRRFISKEIAPKFKIQQIGFDRKFAHNIIYDLRDEPDWRLWPEKISDDEPDRLVEIHQGETGLGNALQEFHRLVLRGEIQHDGHPILNWNRGNARVITTRSGLKLLSKTKSTDKIDGLHAASMAFALAQRGKPQEETDPFAQRGLFIL